MANVFLKECEVKKTNQYDALKVWTNLEMGKELYLYKDKENVFLCYIDKNNTSALDTIANDKIFKIGIISKEDAIYIESFLEALQIKDDSIGKVIKNTDQLFECLISKVDKKVDENKRFSVAIFIKKSS